MAGISLLIVSLFGCLHISGMGYLSNWFLSTPSLYIIEANVQNALDTIWGNQVLVPDGAQEYSFGQVEVSTQPAPPTIQIRGTTISDYQEYSGSFQYIAYSSIYQAVSSNTSIYNPQQFLQEYQDGSAILIELKNGTYQVTIPNYQPTLWEQVQMLFGLAQRDGLAEEQEAALANRLQHNTYVRDSGASGRNIRDAYLLFCVPLVPTGAGRLTQVYTGYLSGRGSILNLTGLWRRCWRGAGRRRHGGPQTSVDSPPKDGPKIQPGLCRGQGGVVDFHRRVVVYLGWGTEQLLELRCHPLVPRLFLAVLSHAV